MDVVLMDAGGANLGSVEAALQRLGVQPRRVADAATLGQPDRIVLPGVGTAAQGMALLRARGLVDALKTSPAPLLGICLGMQLLFEASEEGASECLGLLPGSVRKLAAGPGIRVPHMGWNTLLPEAASPLLAGLGAQTQMYFVHSYAAPVSADCLASCMHGTRFAAVVAHGRVCGAQFHPERSGPAGARFLRNFLEWQP